MAEVQEALRLYPEFAEAHEVLGLPLPEQGRLHEAVAQMQQALVLHRIWRRHLGRLPSAGTVG